MHSLHATFASQFEALTIIMLANRGGSRAGLCVGPLVPFSCEKFLSTVVCNRKHCPLREPWPPAPESAPACQYFE